MLKTSEWLLDAHNCPGFSHYEITSHLDLPPHTHHTEYLYIETPKRYALVNITPLIEDALHRSQIQDGLCFVSSMHITAGIYINDAENGLLHDISSWLENLAPFGKNYFHHQTGEDNGDAHLKSYLTGHEKTVPVTFGKLDLGTWQQLFYAEFDGKRMKRVLIKLMGLKKVN